MASSSRGQTQQKAARPSPFQNTAVWIPYLEPEMDYHTLLGSIRDIGKVKCAKIYRYPELKRPRSSACIVFFSHNAAKELITQARRGKFVVLDRGREVSWRNAYVAEEPGHEEHSRVLRIEGPPNIVNKESLELFWGRFLTWDTDTVADIGMGAIWYFFASWGQAAAAMAMLTDYYGDAIVVSFSIDPCGN